MHPIVKIIQQEFVPVFQEKMKDIFGTNLIFAFICGGFSKGYANENHDIDTFICLQKHSDKQVEKYIEWYFNVHKYYNLPADYTDPGEVVEFDYLLSSLEILKNFEFNTLEVKDYKLYESIVWGDMLSDKIIGMTGDLDTLGKLQKQCFGYPEVWKKQVLNLIPKEDASFWIDKAPQLLMEKYVKYPKK